MGHLFNETIFIHENVDLCNQFVSSIFETKSLIPKRPIKQFDKFEGNGSASLSAPTNQNDEDPEEKQILRPMLHEIEEGAQDVVGLTSKFCNTPTCPKCFKKKRRSPEDQSIFLRICSYCENLFIRKILFEEFWNSKLYKEKKILIKQTKLERLQSRVESHKKAQEKRERRLSESIMSVQILEGIEDKIVNMDNKIKQTNEKELSLMKEQFRATKRVVSENNKLDSKKKYLGELRVKKDFYKASQIQDLHRKQDLQLKVKYFLEKIMDKHKLSEVTTETSQTSEFEIKKKSRVSKGSLRGNRSLSKKEKQKLLNKKKKYKEKNLKIANTSTICGGCQSCRVF